MNKFINKAICHPFILIQVRSPRILLASYISLGIMVTLFPCIAHKFVSSNTPTIYASAASCNANTADDQNLKSFLYSDAISLTSLQKGSFLIRRSAHFWYFLISLNATVPGLYLCGFLTPPVVVAVFLAAFQARCFLGALVPVFFLAVCFVRAMICSDDDCL